MFKVYEFDVDHMDVVFTFVMIVFSLGTYGDDNVTWLISIFYVDDLEGEMVRSVARKEFAVVCVSFVV